MRMIRKKGGEEGQGGGILGGTSHYHQGPEAIVRIVSINALQRGTVL